MADTQEALRLLRKVATEYLEVDDGPDGKGCGWCGLNEDGYEHAPTCLVVKARAALAALPSNVSEPPSDPPALAQPSASIDVERLAQALFYSIGPGNLNGYPYDDEYRAIFRENADDTLAEYARLSAQPEAQPDEDADAVER